VARRCHPPPTRPSGAQLWVPSIRCRIPAHAGACASGTSSQAAAQRRDAWGDVARRGAGLLLSQTGRRARLLRRHRLCGIVSPTRCLALAAKAAGSWWAAASDPPRRCGILLARQPVLGNANVQGMPVPAVIQATRRGRLYVFERTRGQPLFPITEQPVPRATSRRAGGSTQPFSSLPALTSRAPVQPGGCLHSPTFWDRGGGGGGEQCRELIALGCATKEFYPPYTRGRCCHPSGGVNWGGIVFDEQRERVIAAVNHCRWWTLISHHRGKNKPFERTCARTVFRIPIRPTGRHALSMRREPRLALYTCRARAALGYAGRVVDLPIRASSGRCRSARPKA